MGYIDRTGAVAIPPQFDLAQGFYEGLALVRLSGKWWFIDRSGTFVGPGFNRWGRPARNIVSIDESTVVSWPEAAGSFRDGRAVVKTDGGYGYIDHAGEFVIEPQFARAQGFVGGLALVLDGDRIRYIDTDGEVVYSMELPAESRGSSRLYVKRGLR